MKIVSFNPLCLFDVIVAGILIALPFFAVQQWAAVCHEWIFLTPAVATWNISLPAPIVGGVARTSNTSAAVAGGKILASTNSAVAQLLKSSNIVLPALFSGISYSGSSGVVSFNSDHVTAILVFVASVLLSRQLWRWWNVCVSPVQVIRTPTKPRTSRMQKAADFPPPFPNGWFLVEHSHKLAKGQVQEVQAFGQILVLFRGMDGKAQVLDGICPHLGANLGVAGEVSDNCLKCCFHGWEFDREGKCNKVHGTEVIPANAFIKKYPTRERNGCIFVWYDVEGRDPTWEIEVDTEVENGNWYIAGETFNVVHAHINEIPENGSDAAHLGVLHEPFIVDSFQPAMTHKWSVTWDVDKEKPHCSSIKLTQSMTIGKFNMPFGEIDARIFQIGPGLVVLRLDTIFGPLVTYETILPTRCTSQVARHITFASPSVPRLVGRLVMWAFEGQFNRDVPIWESKKYLPKPLISKADGPIMLYRRWMSQFYTPSSVTFADALAKEYMLDW